MTLESINPATGEHIASYPETDEAVVRDILSAADAASRSWRTRHFADRSAAMRRAAGVLRERRERDALMIAREMGKPIAQAQSEIDKCAWVCEYFAEEAERFLAPEPVPTDAARSWVTFPPLGVVLAIMPWNFPFWQV